MKKAFLHDVIALLLYKVANIVRAGLIVNLREEGLVYTIPSVIPEFFRQKEKKYLESTTHPILIPSFMMVDFGFKLHLNRLSKDGSFAKQMHRLYFTNAK